LKKASSSSSQATSSDWDEIFKDLSTFFRSTLNDTKICEIKGYSDGLNNPQQNNDETKRSKDKVKLQNCLKEASEGSNSGFIKLVDLLNHLVDKISAAKIEEPSKTLDSNEIAEMKKRAYLKDLTDRACKETEKTEYFTIEIKGLGNKNLIVSIEYPLLLKELKGKTFVESPIRDLLKNSGYDGNLFYDKIIERLVNYSLDENEKKPHRVYIPVKLAQTFLNLNLKIREQLVEEIKPIVYIKDQLDMVLEKISAISSAHEKMVFIDNKEILIRIRENVRDLKDILEKHPLVGGTEPKVVFKQKLKLVLNVLQELEFMEKIKPSADMKDKVKKLLEDILQNLEKMQDFLQNLIWLQSSVFYEFETVLNAITYFLSKMVFDYHKEIIEKIQINVRDMKAFLKKHALVCDDGESWVLIKKIINLVLDVFQKLRDILFRGNPNENIGAADMSVVKDKVKTILEDVLQNLEKMQDILKHLIRLQNCPSSVVAEILSSFNKK
jgi:hypothetical protein